VSKRKKRPVNPDDLDRIDMGNLKSHDYARKSADWNKVFLLRHRKYPGKVAEIRALSAFHACRLLGWRPRHVEVLEEREAESEPEKMEKGNVGTK